MQWSDIQRDPDRRTLRQFALIWIVFFACLAVYQQTVRDRPLAAAILAVLAVTVGPVGLLWPRAVRHILEQTPPSLRRTRSERISPPFDHFSSLSTSRGDFINDHLDYVANTAHGPVSSGE